MHWLRFRVSGLHRCIDRIARRERFRQKLLEVFPHHSFDAPFLDDLVEALVRNLSLSFKLLGQPSNLRLGSVQASLLFLSRLRHLRMHSSKLVMRFIDAAHFFPELITALFILFCLPSPSLHLSFKAGETIPVATLDVFFRCSLKLRCLCRGICKLSLLRCLLQTLMQRSEHLHCSLHADLIRLRVCPSVCHTLKSLHNLIKILHTLHEVQIAW